ncbi:MAG TPA: helix-turn-helix domain-containing protein, partial [Rugosimonospora sp.]|nr:helix-turn-helix domain-containing protein [Rugosimonospora sp.]
PIDGDVVAIVAARPEPLAGAVLAVAGPVPLAEVPRAYAEATRVLAVARRYGRTGVVDRSSLSVRVAVGQQVELGELLYRRYLAELAPTPAGRELLGTVRVLLQHRRSVPATAEALSVHENTVRYRLARFGELTGADLADTDTLVEVWWALEYAAIRDPD